MKLLAAIAASATLLGAAFADAKPLRVTLKASGHTPKVNVRWPYTVRATVGGKLVAGRITVQIVDPLGGKHLVEYGKSTKKIRNRPFKGVFRDFIIWPPESRGVPLKLRITVVAAHKKKAILYRVVPRK